MTDHKMVTKYDAASNRWVMGYYLNWKFVTVATWSAAA